MAQSYSARAQGETPLARETPPRADKTGPDEVRRALALLCDPEDIIEIRAFKVKLPNGKTVEVRWKRFQPGELKEAAEFALGHSGQASGVYVVMNPIKLDTPSKRSATDEDIARRRWLLIDIDPDKPKNGSATDAEKDY